MCHQYVKAHLNTASEGRLVLMIPHRRRMNSREAWSDFRVEEPPLPSRRLIDWDGIILQGDYTALWNYRLEACLCQHQSDS